MLDIQELALDKARAIDVALASGTPLEEALTGDFAIAAKAKKKREKEYKKALLDSGLFTKEKIEESVPKGPAETAVELLAAMQKPAKVRKLGEMERKDMPQLQAWQAKDDGVPMGKLEFVDPKKLKYTQEKINDTKAQGIANHWDTIGKEPVLISRDNWVLDGHHRVEAARRKHKWVRCYRVDLPGRKALNRLNDVDTYGDDD